MCYTKVKSLVEMSISLTNQKSLKLTIKITVDDFEFFVEILI